MRNMIKRSIIVASVLFVLTLIYLMLSLYFMNIIMYLFMIAEGLLLLTGMVNLLISMRLMGTKSDKWPKYKYNVFVFIYILLFLVSVDSIILSSIMKHKARKEIVTFLSNIDIENTTIKLDGLEIDKRKTLYGALLDVKIISTSRSHSSDKISCEIVSDNMILLLDISQNLGKSNQYWVYYPKYRYTGGNRIGGFYIEELSANGEKIKGLRENKRRKVRDSRNRFL